ncbi:Tripartite tricarboxylate transporter family receptor [compost metagenome]
MRMPISITRRHLLGIFASTATLPVGAIAQSTRTVRLIVNTSAGSGLDTTARAIQSALGQALGAAIVIDNQAGASGLIGLQALARASADGGTLGLSTTNLAIFPSILKTVPFNVTTDFTPIAIIGEVPLVMIANPAKVRATNAKEFVTVLKSNPSAFNYASSGSGTILHLASELLLEEIGVKIKHIPYKGATPMLMDTISGQVDFAAAALPAALPYIKSGALRAIGLCAAQRVPLAPEIPTFAEQGIPNVVVRSWASVLGPKGMEPATVKKYHEAIVTVLKDAAVRDALGKQAMVIGLQTPEEAQVTIRGDVEKYAKLAKKIGLETQ